MASDPAQGQFKGIHIYTYIYNKKKKVEIENSKNTGDLRNVSKRPLQII